MECTALDVHDAAPAPKARKRKRQDEDSDDGNGEAATEEGNAHHEAEKPGLRCPFYMRTPGAHRRDACQIKSYKTMGRLKYVSCCRHSSSRTYCSSSTNHAKTASRSRTH